MKKKLIRARPKPIGRLAHLAQEPRARAEERKVKVGEETDESEEGEKKLINNLKSTEKRNKWKG